MAGLGALLLPFRAVAVIGVLLVQSVSLLWFLHAAYDIRLYPIKDFGHIIHEFDPWFNYRATEYLAENGLSKFLKWYDYESWYPIGRPVGTTIYPGMQVTAVGIWEVHKQIPAFKFEVPATWKKFNGWAKKVKKFFGSGAKFMPTLPKIIEFKPMSVNDICCMMPAWFGSLASLFTGLLTYEISRSVNAGLMAVGIMSVLPAHLMRSVAGEFDNEAVAMTAIVMTFWAYIRSIRTPSSWPFGILTGILYFYMVAVWGGYIFVLNMIGVHALMLVGLGRFNYGVYRAYSLFYIIGTSLAIQIPVVGWTPLRSLEQMGPLLVFLGYQVLAFSDYQRISRGLTTKEFVFFRIKASICFLVVLAVVGTLLWPTGFFGPLSSRIRGLFVKHTKTGNPLVDSVAEHQPASAGMYSTYLHMPLDYWQYGAAVCALQRTSGCYFAFLYGFIAQHFSGKMSRLVLICAPIVTIAAAIWAGFLLDFILQPMFLLLGKKGYTAPESVSNEGTESKTNAGGKENGVQDTKKEGGKQNAKKANGAVDSGKSKKGGKSNKVNSERVHLQEYECEARCGGLAHIKRGVKGLVYNLVPQPAKDFYFWARAFADRNVFALVLRLVVSAAIVYYVYYKSGIGKRTKEFVDHADNMARQMSNPQVMYKVPDRQGGTILVDDYYKGYLWIDKNTPKDSRVMAWWDYGYQITGIAKRASIADGNTWNHEHIATLGRTLTSPEKKAHNAIRHLADYVLVWAGGRGDDLGKSPHLARIGNSVFPDHCGDKDPKCNKFSFYQDGTPTPMMAKSLLYKLVQHNLKPGVKVDEKLFKEVHTTQYGLMRVFKVMNVSQESKDWVRDPKNKVCDAPGSWYCTGQYPPALKKLIDKRRSFSQVEDFNKKGEKSAYTKLIDKELGRDNGDL